MSRVANNPINVPDTVNVSMSDNVVLIKGNKGELDFSLPSSISIDIKDDVININYNSENQEFLRNVKCATKTINKFDENVLNF